MPPLVDLRGWQVHQSVAELSGSLLSSNALSTLCLSSDESAVPVSTCLGVDRHLFVSSVVALGILCIACLLLLRLFQLLARVTARL